MVTRKALGVRLAIFTLAGACAAFGVAALGEVRDAAAKGAAGPIAKRYDANNQTALSESMEAVVDGSRKYVAHDVEGAIVLFRKAIKLQPRNALAQYALGEALLGQDKLEDAEEALMAADDAAPQTSPAKPRILFVLATAKERLHDWDEAREVWRRYLELARVTDGGVFPESANERMRLVDQWAKLDAAYAVVRARLGIDGGAAAPAGATPAADAGAGK